MSEELEFDGERFTPESVREIWYEHMHRYAFAARFVDGLDVLDAACGEGYGAAMLAATAASVTAIDNSGRAVAHASARYRTEKLEFRQADCCALPFEEDAFDCVVSFETIEHLEDQEGMLAEFRRVLKPDGFLLISSPDKKVYSDATGFENPHHVRELYAGEFRELLKARFPAVRMLGQKLMFHSAIWPLDDAPPLVLQQTFQDGRSQSVRRPVPEAMYLLAFCAAEDAALPGLEHGLCLFDDAEESVYAHYHHEIRKNMAAGAILEERDRQLAEARAALEQTPIEGAVRVIIVNYNAGEGLLACVEAALDAPETGRVVVADNASSDGSLELLESRFAGEARLEVRRNQANLGFARAVNGVARDCEAPYLLVLNPDCLLQEGALTSLVEAMQADEQAGIAAPWVTDADGKVQKGTWRRLPDPWRSLLTLSGLHRWSKRVPALSGIEGSGAGRPEGPTRVEAVSGACMLLRASAAKRVGFFDEQYAMHCEDLDLMFRLREAGYHCLLVPQARAVHVGGVSSASRRWWVHRQKHAGMHRYFRLHLAANHAPPMRWLVYLGIWGHYLVTLPLVPFRRRAT